MSSIFGTFRRPKKKPTGEEPELSRTSTVFSSTPNLLKIDQNRVMPNFGKSNSYKMAVNQGQNQNEPHPQNGDWNEGGFDSRRSFSSVAAEPETGVNLNKQGTLGKKSSSIRSFMSMMNVMGSMKRSKSVRKLGWGSSLNVSSPNSKESSPAPSQLSTTSSSGKEKKKESAFSKSKSEEILDVDFPTDLVDSSIITPPKDEFALDTSKSSRRRYKHQDSTRSSSSSRKSQSKSRNTEPGVLTSSESSSSENSSLQDNSSIRASSERSEELNSYNSDSEMESGKEKDPIELERKKNILLGTKKFNMDPKKGIAFLVEKAILEFTAGDVARFLKDGYGLSKGSIGNYLGERQDFNEAVLKSFVELHNFGNLILVEALRQFLWAFRLPGESQKISRMLDAFAERYCANNVELGVSTDTCSVLCYSIIMLNTELHNPNVKEKVTLDQFIKRNRGIEGGELFSRQFFVSLYNSILDEPFRFPEEDGNDLMLTFFNPDYEGWVYKFGGRPRGWKRLWFILSNNCLYYFKFTTDKTPLGIIPLENILVRVPPEKPGSKLHSMILYKESPDPRIIDQIKTCKTLSGGQIVPKLYSSIQLGTPERKERERWVRAINTNHSMSRFYSDLTLKKAKMQLSRAGGPVGVRKSQISLPSSTTTLTLTTPDQDGSMTLSDVSQDPSKDPNNFFISKNLSSISLLGENNPSGDGDEAGCGSTAVELELKTRSRSESRLYQGRKSSLEVVNINSAAVNLSPISRARSNSNPKSPVMRRRNRHGHLQPLTSIFSNSSTAETPSPTSPNLSRSSLRRKPNAILRTETATAIYEKYKKLSMINELSGGGPGVEGSRRLSSSESSSEDKDKVSGFLGSIPKLETTSSLIISRISNSSTCSSDSGGSDDTEFEYRALKEDPGNLTNLYIPSDSSCCGSSSNLLDKSVESINLLDLEYTSIPPLPPDDNFGDKHSDFDSNGNLVLGLDQIQIIDCSNPNVVTESVPFIDDDEEGTKESENFVVFHENSQSFSSDTFCDNDNDKIGQRKGSDKGENIPNMCYESIYESNV